MTAEPWRTERISEDEMKRWEELIAALGENSRGRAHELLIAAFHEIRGHRLARGSTAAGPGSPAPRTVTCAWCGNHYRSAIPSDLDRGLQGSHCASDVILKDGQWIVRGGYGSDKHDMNCYVFVANHPSLPADPVCDECISQRLHDGDLQEKPPVNPRHPRPRMPDP
jgi:hypothetical protein